MPSAASAETVPHLVNTGEKVREITIRIENMHCGACVRRVSQALERVGGVQVDEVRIGAARVQAQDEVPEGAIVSAVERAGYPAVVEQ